VPDVSHCQGLLEKCVQFPLFFGGHWIDLSEPGQGFALECNSVVPFPTFREVVEDALAEYVLEFVQ
jgi:hypothetical protein